MPPARRWVCSMSFVLTQEEMWDRPIGGESKEKEIPHWCGNIIYVIVGFLCKLVCRYKVSGRQNIRNLKGQSGVVLVCNHTSILDAAFLYCAVRPSQWPRLIGRDDLFKPGLGGQLMARVGAFPIKRDAADRSAVKRAARMLKNKEIIAIFPEGTRRNKGSQKPEIHGGCALMARMGKAPIVPMTIRGADKVKVKGEFFFHWPTVTIEFGKPIYVDSFDFLPKADRLEGCTWYALRECYALSARTSAERVDMPELFPDAKDYTDAFADRDIAREQRVSNPSAQDC